MRFRTTSRYVKTNPKKPKSLGMCDRTGFLVMHYDLRPQYQYAGSGKVNTGFLIHKDYIDKLNPQQLAPKAYLDPYPVPNPRPPMPAQVMDPVLLVIDVSDGGERILTLDEIAYTYITIEGTPSVETTIIVPAQFKSYIVTNLVTSMPSVFIKMSDFAPSNSQLQANSITYVTCTGTNLLVTKTEKRD